MPDSTDDAVSVMIEVTADDILDGEPCRCNRCPIALAVGRKTGIRVEVGIGSVVVSNWSVELPPKALDSRSRFDAWLPVSPFSFPLTLPWWLVGDAPLPHL